MKRRRPAPRAHKSRSRRQPDAQPPRFRVRYSCPPALYDPKAFSHVVEVEGGRLIFLSGQVPVDDQRRLASRDLREQIDKVFDNLEAALKSVGAGFENVLKTTNYLTSVTQAGAFREAREARFARLKNRPASTTIVIAGLVDPDYLLEIELIAAVPAR